MKRALKAQINYGIESIYIKSSRNPHTKKIYQNIPDILTYLFIRHRKIEEVSNSQKENDVRNMPFHPSDPLVTIFAPFEDLREIRTYAHNPYSETQLITYVLEIFKKTHDFEK